MKAQVDISKSAVAMIGSAFGRKETNVVVPIYITGTTRDPQFTSDSSDTQALQSTGSLAEKEVKGLSNSLDKLFGKKGNSGE
jgi:hypothetical protein